MNRRRLLAQLAGSFPLLLAGRLYAAPTSGPRLLLVFLRGGYDCANLLIPYASADYYELRPRIAIARPGASEGALALDADWALAPAVRDTLGVLYRERQAALVPFAGTDDLSRSHFETQDSIELGQPAGRTRDFSSGFLARLCAVLTGATPIAFTDSLPLVLRGRANVPNISLRGVGKPPFDAHESALLLELYAGQPLQEAIADGLELQQQVARTMATEMRAASRGAINARGFELEAERMARLMRSDYRVGFIDVGGWDTHVGEGAERGALASRLEELGRGLQSFARALDSDWSETVVVVVSEFGRTFRENGDAGTDHGHGSVYWVLGGRVQGGRMAGEQVRVARATLFQDRDYPVLNDYRAVLGGLFGRLWNLSPAQLEHVFPGAAPRDLRLV
ncbi:MAG TPA: DUF1501 domain-containing protein [Steroidobacteraceae bacterium]|nr:DUF1501 domain-containing protein [Steroidobacteraceae bacterium]